MELTSVAARRAYTSVTELGNSSKLAPVTLQQPPSEGDDFGAMMKSAVIGLRDGLNSAESVSLDALAGRADAQSVVEAVAKAELSLQTASVVRDKIVQAYQDILRMPV